VAAQPSGRRASPPRPRQPARPPPRNTGPAAPQRRARSGESGAGAVTQGRSLQEPHGMRMSPRAKRSEGDTGTRNGSGLCRLQTPRRLSAAWLATGAASARARTKLPEGSAVHRLIQQRSRCSSCNEHRRRKRRGHLPDPRSTASIPCIFTSLGKDTKF